MGKILDAFADDELSVNPSLYRGKPEYREAVDTMYEISEELDAKLNDEEKKLFEQFRDAQADENHLYQIDVFNRGFRIYIPKNSRYKKGIAIYGSPFFVRSTYLDRQWTGSIFAVPLRCRQRGTGFSNPAPATSPKEQD